MALGDALAIVGAWAAALAVGDPYPWPLICRRAADKSRSPHARHAWRALGAAGRTTVAGRLHAAGIHTTAPSRRPHD